MQEERRRTNRERSIFEVLKVFSEDEEMKIAELSWILNCRKHKKDPFFELFNEKITIHLLYYKKKAEKFFSAFLFHTTLKSICSKVEYYEPNQAFNGKESQSCPSHTLEPLFKL